MSIPYTICGDLLLYKVVIERENGDFVNRYFVKARTLECAGLQADRLLEKLGNGFAKRISRIEYVGPLEDS